MERRRRMSLCQLVAVSVCPVPVLRVCGSVYLVALCPSVPVWWLVCDLCSVSAPLSCSVLGPCCCPLCPCSIDTRTKQTMRSPSPDDSSLRTLLLPPYSHEEHDPAVRTHVATSSMAERDLLPIDRTMHMDMHMDMTADSDAETRDPHKRKVTPDHTQRHESEPADQTIDHDNQSEPRTPTESNPAKRARRNPSVRCPICNEVVPPGQYQQHYRMELAQIESSSSHERYGPRARVFYFFLFSFSRSIHVPILSLVLICSNTSDLSHLLLCY